MALCSPLFGDGLTVDPKEIRPLDCSPCTPEIFYERPLEDAITVDLRRPIYQKGVLSTEEGGVLTAPRLRIQAQKIIYIRRPEHEPPELKVFCSGDLLVEYRNRILTGLSLEYDFLTKTGKILQGKTSSPPWYMGSEEILLLENGDLVLVNSYITTSETGEREVELFSPEVTLSRNQIATITKPTFRLLHCPLFWLPKSRIDLKTASQSPFAINFGWGGFLGTHIGIRYQFFNWHDLKGFARLDGYYNHGLGAGIETVYNPPDLCTEFYTRNYYVHDLSIDDHHKRDRYRFQGTYYDTLFTLNTIINGMYDFVSDGQMAANFQEKDFHLNTAGRTQLTLRRREEQWIANLFARVRVNSFQSINQALPAFTLTLLPYELGHTGIVAENYFSLSYLDYVFSKEVAAREFHSGRWELHPRLYRPFYFGPFITTPEASFIGIAYSNTPDRGAIGEALGEIGCRLETSLVKQLSCLTHTLQPYGHYHLLTTPQVSADDHFIFTIRDGYAPLHFVRLGLRNGLTTPSSRPLWVDLWTNLFISTHKLPQALPKGYLDIEWQPYGRLHYTINSAWNFTHNQLDYYNSQVKWTASENFAAALEYRHRSRFAWRKADFYNFMLDSTRTENELLPTPISDRRDTFLTHFFYRINPDWAAKFELREGWNRENINQLPYLEYQAELNTVIFQHWLLNFTYEKRESDNRYSVSLKLAPTPSNRK